VHGVVYDPLRNELFTASQGRGAFLTTRRIPRLQVPEAAGRAGRHRPSRSRNWTGSICIEAIEKLMENHRRAARRRRALDLPRRLRPASMPLELGSCRGNVAAGALLIRKLAPGRTDLEGGPGIPRKGRSVRASPKIFPTFLRR